MVETLRVRPGLRIVTRPARCGRHNLIDLPGLYGLEAVTPEEEVTEAALRGDQVGETPPDAIILVVDATNLERNLFLVSEVLELRRPTLVALTLIDSAETTGIEIDLERLEAELGCPVVPVSARTGAGLGQLRETLGSLLKNNQPVIASERESCLQGCTGCPFTTRYDWASRIAEAAVRTPETHGRTTAAIDRVLTQPTVGILAFLAVMLGVFYLIFSLADVPMTLIDEGFSVIATIVGSLIPSAPIHWSVWCGSTFCLGMGVFWLAYRAANIKWSRVSAVVAVSASAVVSVLPAEDLRSLLVDGVVGGVGGIVVFLPQICILFFFISLLEDSGYLARAAFVMERVMRFVGLPGKAFVPMLAAHACAIPGIMAARVIENRRDRLVTVLVLPLLTCSARLPVYAMVAALLFGDSPGKAAIVFLGAYLLGIAAALIAAFCLKQTLLRGETVPLVLELPPYRLPSLRNALYTVFDRAVVFLKNAGSVILLISVVLWGMATYPKMPADALPPTVASRVEGLRTEAAALVDESAKPLLAEADRLIAQEELAYSWAGRLGHAAEPVFRPLGFDWKMNVGVISSFAAREVIVSTLAIIYGVGDDSTGDDATLTETLRRQVRQDGAPVYSTATSLSLLAFYVLAMQCLPTQVVTYRETGSWKWSVFQLGYMTLLAYFVALITYNVATFFQ